MTNENPAPYNSNDDLHVLDPVRLDQICNRAFEAACLCSIASQGMRERDLTDVALFFEVVERMCREIAIACDEEILVPAHHFKTTREKVGAA
jgi:hypothetical protein